MKLDVPRYGEKMVELAGLFAFRATKKQFILFNLSLKKKQKTSFGIYQNSISTSLMVK